MPPKSAASLKQKTAPDALPDPEESGVRLSENIQSVRELADELLSGRFSEMYDLSKETCREFKLAGWGGKNGPHFPDADEVIKVFSPEELALTSEYQDPALILSPPRMARRELFNAISAHSGALVRKGPMIVDSEEISVDADEHYRAFIVESTPNILPANDLIAASLLRRVNVKIKNRCPEEWGMTGDLYALLAMQSMVKGSLIDRYGFTVMDGESVIADRYVPVGHCRKRKPTLEWLPANMETALSRRGRFRRVLGGRSIEK